MGWIDKKWKEKVVKPIEDAGETVSDEFKNAMSGGLDPVVFVNKRLRRSARKIAEEFIEPAQQAVHEEVDYLFDEKVNPLTDKVDQILTARIDQVGNVVNKGIEDAAAEFSTLLNEGKAHVEDILSNVVDPLVKDNLRLAFDLLNRSLAEAKMVLRGLLGEVDAILERNITRMVTQVMNVLSEIKQMAIELIGEIRTQIIEPAFQELNKLEAQLFKDIDAALEKFGNIVTGTQAQIEITRERVTEFLPNPLNKCRQKLGVSWTPGLNLTIIQVYRLEECERLRELEQHMNDWSVAQIKDTYAELQLTAWLFACFARGSEASWDTYIRDWVKYGELYRLWGKSE